jgi:hypothetical protein
MRVNRRWTRMDADGGEVLRELRELRELTEMRVNRRWTRMDADGRDRKSVGHSATFGRNAERVEEIRIPKSEYRRKLEDRKPKHESRNAGMALNRRKQRKRRGTTAKTTDGQDEHGLWNAERGARNAEQGSYANCANGRELKAGEGRSHPKPAGRRRCGGGPAGARRGLRALPGNYDYKEAGAAWAVRGFLVFYSARFC